MQKVEDLDKLKNRMYAYILPYRLEQELASVITELKAAREFIDKVKEIENSFEENVKYDELKFIAICDSLRLYEEATK